MKNIEGFIKREADAWFDRNLSALESHTVDAVIDLLAQWLIPYQSRIKKILEVGSGSGHRLAQICSKLEASGVGVEPSGKAVKYANLEHNLSNCRFQIGTSDALNLNDQKFDLVHLGFFLYLVDRDLYLKSLAEADSALLPGGFLSIIDFDPVANYRKKYHHMEGLSSYKMDNSRVFLSSGLYSLVNKFSFSHRIFGFDENEDERVSLTLLYKEPEAFPER